MDGEMFGECPPLPPDLVTMLRQQTLGRYYAQQGAWMTGNMLFSLPQFCNSL